MCPFLSSYRLNVFQYFSVSRLDQAEETPVPSSAFHHIPQLSFSTTSSLVPISAKFVCFMLPPRRNYLYPIGLATPCVCLFAFLLLSFQLLLLLYFDLHPPRYRCLTRQSLVAFFLPFSFIFYPPFFFHFFHDDLSPYPPPQSCAAGRSLSRLLKSSTDRVTAVLSFPLIRHIHPRPFSYHAQPPSILLRR